MSITFDLTGHLDTDSGLNVSNTNAFALLTRLGIEPDYCGQIDGAALVAACDLALFEIDMDPVLDSGVADTGDREQVYWGVTVKVGGISCGIHYGAGIDDDPEAYAADLRAQGLDAEVAYRPGATYVDCGQRAGYYDHRISALREIGEQAARLGTSVTWG